jgi:hypothetical protein
MHILDYITIGIALAFAVSLIAAYAFGSLPLPPWGAAGATKAAGSGGRVFLRDLCWPFSPYSVPLVYLQK